MIKKIIKYVLFLSILFGLIIRWNDILLPKDRNYMLREKFKEQTDQFDVLVFGSCHAYTSFNPIEFYKQTGLKSYNLARPSESMAATYLQLVDALKTQKPKVVLIESWGIQAYNTYISKEEILGPYLVSLVDNNAFSQEKIKVMNDFDKINILDNSLLISRYKNRLFKKDMYVTDFYYDFDYRLSNEEKTNWMIAELRSRTNNKGYRAADMDWFGPILDYHEQQADLTINDEVVFDETLLKYVQKIINLCETNSTIPIFYRAPYRENETEVQQFNYFQSYLNNQNVDYLDLEKEIDFNMSEDLFDYEHLNVVGATKATHYLADHILSLEIFSEEELYQYNTEWDDLELVLEGSIYQQLSN